MIHVSTMDYQTKICDYHPILVDSASTCWVKSVKVNLQEQAAQDCWFLYGAGGLLKEQLKKTKDE
jgi:hypothetical protein